MLNEKCVKIAWMCPSVQIAWMPPPRVKKKKKKKPFQHYDSQTCQNRYFKMSDIHNMFVLGLGRVPWCPRDGSGRPITRVQIFYPLPEV